MLELKAAFPKARKLRIALRICWGRSGWIIFIYPIQNSMNHHRHQYFALHDFPEEFDLWQVGRLFYQRMFVRLAILPRKIGFKFGSIGSGRLKWHGGKSNSLKASINKGSPHRHNNCSLMSVSLKHCYCFRPMFLR
jgi:hypothetical protein